MKQPFKHRYRTSVATSGFEAGCTWLVVIRRLLTVASQPGFEAGCTWLVVWTAAMVLSGITACKSQAQPPGTPIVSTTPQRGVPYESPKGDLGLKAQTLTVATQFRSFVQPRSVNLPAGFTAKVFYAGNLLSKPRFLAWSPDSVLHVADVSAGRIIALPDRDRDGIADTAIVAASSVFAHDLKFYNGALYAAEERRILRLTDANRDGIYETRSTFIDNIAEGATQPGGGHRTRTIVFDPARRKLYLSIGSLCNVCREEFRAIIEEWNDDGTGRSTYATGIRNAVGMTLHPRTGRLWATNNGSDWQGNEIPPEWIDLVRPSGFYGYPFAHSYQTYFDFNAGNADYRALLPITSSDSARIRTMQPPAALITAHSAPMAIEFANPAFPESVRRGAFVALRGSWNRSPLAGYKVVYLDFDNDQDTTANFAADFLTGFLTDSVRGERWARPVGLESDARGNLYVGSDELTRFILIVSPDRSTSTRNNQNLRGADGTSNAPNTLQNGKSSAQKARLSLAPNPHQDKTIVRFSLTEPDTIALKLFDGLGNCIATLAEGFHRAGEHTLELDMSKYGSAASAYFCRLQTSSGLESVPLLRLR